MKILREFKNFIINTIKINLSIFIISVIISFNAYSQSMEQRLQDFLQHNFSYNHFGIVVQSLDDNKILYQNNQDKLFVPASLVKLFTLASSLEELTPKFKFKTQLGWDKKKIYDNNLTSDLGIIFSGDPSFTQLQVEDFIITLKKYGVNNIEGDIIIDDTLFSDRYANGLVIDDLSWGYAAPSGAIVIAENKIPIIVNPISNLGQKVEFCVNPDKLNLYPFNINSKVIAVSPLPILQECDLKVFIDTNNDIFFSGCAAIEPNRQKINLALNSPKKYLQDLLILYLNKYKISLLGNIVFKKIVDKFPHGKIYNSLPLSELLKIMMKSSNNIYAHSIGKFLGVKLYGHGTFQTASKAITNILHRKFTINTGTLNLVDSSGLSVYNVATPNHFIRLLQAVYNNKNLYTNMSKILSKPGDGTLSNRLTADDLRANIIAKTGTLKHASGLAGYIKTKKGSDLAFVFMVNDLLQNDFKIKQLIDELCEILINYN